MREVLNTELDLVLVLQDVKIYYDTRKSRPVQSIYALDIKSVNLTTYHFKVHRITSDQRTDTPVAFQVH